MIVYAADDEELALALLEESIIEAIPGVIPVCFRDPDELLRAAEETVPDIVFLDINMEGTDGIEVAKKLNEISNTVKIIFVTGYTEYMADAFDVYAAGYVMKPCRAKNIKPIIDRIQVPLSKPKDIVIKTFGNFEIYYKNHPISFRSKLGKEMLAYLVDREGAKVSRQEIAGILYEDDFSHSVQSSLSKIVKSISEDLEKFGIGDLFVSDGGYYVDLSMADCDFVEYLKGNPNYKFTGEYMEQYSFGEFRKAAFFR